MANTVFDVMILCKTKNHPSFAKVFVGSAKLLVILTDTHMKSAS